MTDSQTKAQPANYSASAKLRPNPLIAHGRLSVALVVAIILVSVVTGMVADPLAPQSVLAQADNQLGILSVVGADGAVLYNTPEGVQVRSLSAGTALNATGRSADGGWVMVTTTDDESGWVEVESVVLFGLSSLPVEFGEAAAAELTATPDEEASPTEAVATSTPTEPPPPTPSPSPTTTPTLTSTPTPMPPPTVTPTSVLSMPASTAAVMAVVRGGGATLSASPGGASIQDLRVGATLNATAISEDGKWIRVRTADSAEGWVESVQVIAFRLDSLPQVAVEMSAPPAADAEGTVPAQEESSVAAETPAAPQTGSTILPPVESQVRRPAPENTEGQFVAAVAMSGSRLNIRSAPGTSSAIIGKALPDEQFIALARTSDSAWVQIEVPDLSAGVGWVSSQFIQLNEPIADLPVSDQAPNDLIPTVPQDGSDTSSQSSTAQPNEAARVVGRASAAPGLSGRLVFQTALGATIYVYDLASGDLRYLTGGADPAISPDGSMVAFTRFGGDGGVYVINIDGTGERRLWASAEGPRSPKWSPDGTYVLFSRLTGEYPCRNVGFGLCVPNTPFTRQLPLIRKDERGLTRIDLNGENFRDIPALNTAQAPDWTAAGIVYQATTSIEITYDTPEYEGTHVFNEIVGYQDPAWQPGGDRIVYQDKGPDHTEIWSVRPDGSGNRPLTGPLTTLVEQLPSNVSPSWSPDGQRIVYLSSRGPEESEGPWRLWVMDADGGNKRPLPIDLEFVYQHNMEQMVSWGP